jgi:cysteinyl-tRNA synthetase
MNQADRRSLIQQIVADLREEAFLAVCKAIDTPNINLEATEANCQMIEVVADYIEERYADDAYATG